MEIYIEYVFIENFAFDLVLCYLAFKLVRLPIKKLWLCVSAFVGACLAVAYPFFNAFTALATSFKLGFPLLACFLGFGGKILKNERGRYALSVISYYLLSFLLAGGVYAYCGAFGIEYAFGDGLYLGAPMSTVFAVSVFTVGGVSALVKKIYARRRSARFIYPCELVVGDRQVRAEGYLDSGNLAQKSGVPVCFLSAELFFDVFGERAFDEGEEELCITTVAGEKRVKLFILDELKIYFPKKKNIVYKPYCAISPAMQGKEYKLLLGAWAADGEE